MPALLLVLIAYCNRGRLVFIVWINVASLVARLAAYWACREQHPLLQR